MIVFLYPSAVLEAPVLLQNLSDCSVNISNSVTLQCPVSGVPRPLITWYKDRRMLKQVSGEKEIQEVFITRCLVKLLCGGLRVQIAVKTNLILLGPKPLNL